LYKSLVKDEQWHVRHSILFALPGILARVDAAQRRSLTVPSLVHLSLDPSDPVRSGLLEVLGEVIYTFRDDPEGPPRELLRLFIQDRDWSKDARSSPAPSYQSFHSVVDWFSDPERPIICAFNFPAVIFTVGAKRWPEVRNYYLHLAKFPTAKVLRTLAASLGEVAAIIGPENAQADLIPIFLSALRSTEPEVRCKIIEALPKFALSLSESKREWIVAELSSVWPDLGGWREREDLARLLGELVSLSGGGVESVVEIMSKALRDEVAAVREAAISSVCHSSAFSSSLTKLP
jgi:serine/threonine-protein phosphatase 4 regulatory subunit 1